MTLPEAGRTLEENRQYSKMHEIYFLSLIPFLSVNLPRSAGSCLKIHNMGRENISSRSPCAAREKLVEWREVGFAERGWWWL